MRNFIYGFILGSIVFGVGVALAAPGVLFTINNQPISTSNPVYVRGI
jgi:hypothetical protein